MFFQKHQMFFQNNGCFKYAITDQIQNVDNKQNNQFHLFAIMAYHLPFLSSFVIQSG